MSIILAACGGEDTAAMLSEAGADRVIAYHSSAYRRLGLPSVAGLLPWANANDQTRRMLPEVLRGAGSTPVIATVCANDALLSRQSVLAEVKAIGAVGVLNAPTVGLLEGVIRDVLEAEGLGSDAELALIREASELGLEPWCYVFDPQWTRGALDAGARGIIIHLGITGYPSTVDVVGCLRVVADFDSVHVLLHGGSLDSPDALRQLIDDLPADLAHLVDGYMGASVFELAPDAGATIASWRRALSQPDPELESQI